MKENYINNGHPRVHSYWISSITISGRNIQSKHVNMLLEQATILNQYYITIESWSFLHYFGSALSYSCTYIRIPIYNMLTHEKAVHWSFKVERVQYHRKSSTSANYFRSESFIVISKISKNKIQLHVLNFSVSDLASQYLWIRYRTSLSEAGYARKMPDERLRCTYQLGNTQVTHHRKSTTVNFI